MAQSLKVFPIPSVFILPVKVHKCYRYPWHLLRSIMTKHLLYPFSGSKWETSQHYKLLCRWAHPSSSMWFLYFPQTRESVLTVFLLVSANLETLKWIYGSDYRKHPLRSARKISKNRILHGSPATWFFLLLPGQLFTLWSQYFKLWDEKTETLIAEATFLRWDTEYFQRLKTRTLESGFEFRLSLLLLPLRVSVALIVLPAKLENSFTFLTVRTEWVEFKPGPSTREAV